MFEQEFRGLNLAFDERAGAPISVEDAQIAAIATHHRVPLATRYVADFARLPGPVVMNPWEEV